MSLRVRPLTLATANELVAQMHRHHKPAVGHRFSLGAYEGDELVGAVIVGRPVARKTCQYTIAEVIRLVTNGHKNACSFLLGRSARVAGAMGFAKIQTFTLPEEGGASLRAAGWVLEQVITPPIGGWSSRAGRFSAPLFDGLIEEDFQPQGPKSRWARVFAGNQ